MPLGGADGGGRDRLSTFPAGLSIGGLAAVGEVSSGSPQALCGAAALLTGGVEDAAHRNAAAPAARSQRSWALVLTSVAFFMTALDSLVVVTALPAIHASLGGSVATLEWT